MFRWLNLLLLLLCVVYHEGTDPTSVSGKKGGKATFTCEFEDQNISQRDFSNETQNIDVCQTEKCRGRVFQEGSCVIIKDLTFSDAGKYFLHVYYTNDQKEVEQQIRTYQLQIHDEISVKTGENVKLGVLWSNTDKVEKNSSGEWTEVWIKGRGFQSDRLTRSEENLIINNFTSSDAGTYRVLDSKGETLITVTVSSTGSKEKLDNTGHKNWIWPVVAVVAVVAVVVALIIFAVWKCRRQLKNSRTQEHKNSRNKNSRTQETRTQELKKQELKNRFSMKRCCCKELNRSPKNLTVVSSQSVY